MDEQLSSAAEHLRRAGVELASAALVAEAQDGRPYDDYVALRARQRYVAAREEWDAARARYDACYDAAVVAGHEAARYAEVWP